MIGFPGQSGNLINPRKIHLANAFNDAGIFKDQLGYGLSVIVEVGVVKLSVLE